MRILLYLIFYIKQSLNHSSGKGTITRRKTYGIYTQSKFHIDHINSIRYKNGCTYLSYWKRQVILILFYTRILK